jgi:hypothetical protein
MKEYQGHKSRRPPRNFSLEEKRNYCIEWKKSGMNQIDFCKTNEISKSALYQWIKEFRKEENGLGFSPLVVEKKSSAKQTDIIQLSIFFPNQIQLSIAMPEHRLVSFIQEIGYAAAVIR